MRLGAVLTAQVGLLGSFWPFHRTINWSIVKQLEFSTNFYLDHFFLGYSFYGSLWSSVLEGSFEGPYHLNGLNI